MLSTSRAQLTLRILDCALGGRSGVHILSEERTCKVTPEPAALVWFLFVLWRDPFRRDSAAVFLHVEKRALLSRLCRAVSSGVGGGGKERKTSGTLVDLNSISELHLPVTSPSSVPPRRTRPARALYEPEKKPLVLNSRSACKSCASLCAVHASPSSMTILPNKIPRAYMFGIVITYSVCAYRPC
jgi:hypothetical protein